MIFGFIAAFSTELQVVNNDIADVVTKQIPRGFFR